MIRPETVLTATPVVLEQIPEDYLLHQHVGRVIKGLDEVALSTGVYTVDDMVLTLPEATHADSQHETIMAHGASTIAENIRLSLHAIKTHVIPACDKIEEAIKKIGSVHATEDLMFAKLYLNFIHINDAFFTSEIIPNKPEEGYQNGILFDSENITQLGQWPAYTYDDIIALIPEASDYPELNLALNDVDAVEKAWGALGTPVAWLGTTQSKISPKQIEVTSHLKSLMVLALIVNKLAIMDDPIKGVIGISLHDYRLKMNRTKGFVNTLLYYTRKRLAFALGSGVMVIDKEMAFDECIDNKSQFFGTSVLNGQCTVLYNDAVSEYFAASEKYSLSETIIGMILLQMHEGVSGKSFLDCVEQYHDVAKAYLEQLTLTVNKNSSIGTRQVVYAVIAELATQPKWQEYLSEEGRYINTPYRLEELIRQHGGFIEHLTRPTINRRIREGSLMVANTKTSVVLARALGLQLAACILENNLTDETLSLEQQRKTLAKAITKYVVEALLNGRQ